MGPWAPKNSAKSVSTSSLASMGVSSPSETPEAASLLFFERRGGPKSSSSGSLLRSPFNPLFDKVPGKLSNPGAKSSSSDAGPKGEAPDELGASLPEGNAGV